MATHVALGASSASMWLRCVAAGRALKNLHGTPRSASPYAAEGTLAHVLSEHLFVFGNDIDLLIGSTHTVDGHPITVTDDMVRHVKTYVDYVNNVTKNIGAKPYESVEYEVGLSLADLAQRLQRPDPQEPLFGTADVLAIEADDNHGFGVSFDIHVFDLKYGAGVPVEADTPQGKYYALGALLRMPEAMMGDVHQVTIHIIQPRAPHKDGPIRTASYAVHELFKFGKELLDAVDDINSNVVTTYKTGKHCRFCPAAATCEALAKDALATAVGDFNVDDPSYVTKKDLATLGQTRPLDLAHLSDKELGFILEKKDMIKQWLDTVEAKVVSKLSHGTPVPGWKLVEKRAMQKWDASVLPASIISKHDADKLFKTVPVTITEARKILDKSIFADLITHGAIVKSSSGVTLAHETDARKAVSVGSIAADDFADDYDDTEDK